MDTGRETNSPAGGAGEMSREAMDVCLDEASRIAACCNWLADDRLPEHTRRYLTAERAKFVTQLFRLCGLEGR